MIGGMLRLDPAFPPLWRSPWEMQFGLEPAVTLAAPAPWQERLIDELRQGLPDSAVPLVAASLGAPAGACDDLLEAISPALEPQRPVPPPRAVLQIAGDVAAELVETIRAAMTGCGLALETSDWPGEAATDAAVPVIALAAHLVHPARVSALMATDATHLPFVLSGSRVRIGPLVVPGVTACLSCLALTSTDADAAWPVLAAQLCGRTVADVPGPLLVESAARAVRLLSGEGSMRSTTTEVVLTSEPVPRVLRHEPHARCGCRSPAGIATGGGPVIRGTSSAREFARPA